MAQAIIMPKAGMAMEEGTIVRWLKEIGDEITVGEAILEIETDKVSMEVEAEQSGVLLSKTHDAGDVVAVVQPIGYIGKRGETPPNDEAQRGENPPSDAGGGANSSLPSGELKKSVALPQTSLAQKSKDGFLSTEKERSDSVAGGAGSAGRAANSSLPSDELKKSVALPQTSLAQKSKDGFLSTEKERSDSVAGGAGRATPLAKHKAREAGIALAAISASGRSGEILAKDVERAIADGTAQRDTITAATPSPRATPLARKIAAAHDIEIDGVRGSGAAGRVRRSDVEDALQAPAQRAAGGGANSSLSSGELQKSVALPQTSLAQKSKDGFLSTENERSDSGAGGAAGRVRRSDVEGALQAPARASQGGVVQTARTERIRGVRNIIAQRVSATHSEVPPVTLTYPVRMDALQALRTEINSYLGEKTSMNSWLCYAAVRALYRTPQLNCTYSAAAGEINLHDDVHLGIAVDSPNGLLIPTLRSANRMSFIEFDRAVRKLVATAQASKTHMDDLQGASFSVTNLGMYGITHFTPIIPLPQVAILGIGGIRETLTRNTESGQLTTVHELNLLLTVDHRIIDGALAARYLNALGSVLEAPSQLLV